MGEGDEGSGVEGPSRAEPSRLAETLAAGLAALESGADFDLVERALAEETAAAERAEQAALAAAASLLGE